MIQDCQRHTGPDISTLGDLVRLLIERGMERGELKEDLDIELCIDLIYVLVFYRLLVTGYPLDDSYVRQLVMNAFKGIGLD